MLPQRADRCCSAPESFEATAGRHWGVFTEPERAAARDDHHHITLRIDRQMRRAVFIRAGQRRAPQEVAAGIQLRHESVGEPLTCIVVLTDLCCAGEVARSIDGAVVIDRERLGKGIAEAWDGRGPQMRPGRGVTHDKSIA